MKQAKAQAYIRQLCCLGLGKEAMLPELLRALHAVIPSDGNLLIGIDEKPFPTYIIPEHVVPEALDVYMNAQAQIATPSFYIQIGQWFSTHRILPDFRILNEQFYRSDFYHLVLRPYHHHHILQGRIQSNGLPVGTLNLCRSQHQRPFSADEQRQFEHLLAYVEHGMQARGGTDEEYTDSGQAGMIILKHDGTVVYLSDSARTLLLRATYGALPVGQIRFTRDIVLPPPLRQICCNLDQIFQGRDAPPPVYAHTNASGRFNFRAYWLQPPTVTHLPDTSLQYPADDVLIGILIDYQEPLRLKLHRNLHGWRLSIREQEISLAVTEGLSHVAIAARLCISPQTVVTYIRRIYEKLEVHSREELLKKLLSSEPNGTKTIGFPGIGQGRD